MLNSSSAIYLHSRPLTTVTVHPVALFSILDHFLRRSPNEDRVIGTLLGTRVDNVIEVKSSFAVLHKESEEQVAVDFEYHRTVYELHQKVNPRETIVGWCVEPCVRLFVGTDSV
jgi:translation initiation factor 3 subunit F